MNKKGQTTGLVSLILFGSGVGLLALTGILTYLPRDNDFRGVLTWLGLLIGFAFVFLGIPMLLISLVTSIMTIIENHASKAAIVVIIGNILLGISTILWLFM